MEMLVGKITKGYKVETGFKGHLTLPDGQLIYLNCPFAGKTAKYLEESVGKTVQLIGNLRVPSGKDVKDYTWIFDVNRQANGGSPFVRMGRLVADPELQYTPEGKALVKFRLAVDYGFGERKQADFISGIIWGNANEKNQALFFAENGAQGKKVYVEGILAQTEKDGKKYTNLTVLNFQFVAPNVYPAASAKGEQKNANGEQQSEGWEDLGSLRDEEEIPF
jgi:single-strand DNA-binding protein